MSNGPDDKLRRQKLKKRQLTRGQVTAIDRRLAAETARRAAYEIWLAETSGSREPLSASETMELEALRSAHGDPPSWIGLPIALTKRSGGAVVADPKAKATAQAGWNELSLSHEGRRSALEALRMEARFVAERKAETAAQERHMTKRSAQSVRVPKRAGFAPRMAATPRAVRTARALPFVRESKPAPLGEERMEELERAAKAAQFVPKHHGRPTERLEDAMKGSGAAFSVQPDPPRLAKDGKTYCGNPIDGMAYYMVLSRETRASSVFLKWDKVRALAAQMGYVPPPHTKEDPQRVTLKPFVVTSAVSRRDLVDRATAKFFSNPAYESWIPLLRGTATVRFETPSGWMVIPPMRSSTLLREGASDDSLIPAGTRVDISFPTPRALEHFDEFFVDEILPALKADKMEVYPTVDKPGALMKVRARNNPARDRKRPKRVTRARARRNASDDRYKTDAELERERVDGLVAKAEAKIGAGRFLEAADLMSPPSARDDVVGDEWLEFEQKGKMSKMPKAATAVERGDMSTDYASLNNRGQLQFWKVSSKVSKALQHLGAFQAYATRTFTVTTRSSVLDAIVSLSKKTTPAHPYPAAIDAKVVKRMLISSMVTVNGHIVDDPDYVCPPETVIKVGAPLKAEDPNFSWVRSWLPIDAGDRALCLPQEDYEARIKKDSGGAFTVFKTYNPVLFELTRLYWPSRAKEPSWRGVTSQERAIWNVDLVGLYGTALSLTQRIVHESEGLPDARGRARSLLLDSLDGKREEDLVGNKKFTWFNRLWPLGVDVQAAAEAMVSFTSHPLAFVRSLKEQVDKAVPHIVRSRQIGLLRPTARVKQGAQHEHLTALLLIAAGRDGEPIDAKDEKALLLKVQTAPPSIFVRQSDGTFRDQQLKAVPATGEYDAATVRLLNRIANAPKPPPGTRMQTVPMVFGQQIPEEATIRRTDAFLGTLAGLISSIDEALIAIDKGAA